MKKTDIAYELIRQRIIEGIYPPLSEIREDDLLNELNCSRTPLREAFLRLCENGFVMILPGKATLVTPVSKELIEEIYEVRLLNEPHICIRTSKFIKPEILLELKDKFINPPQFESSIQKREYYIKADDLLHSTILKHCGNSFLIKTMGIIFAHNERFRNYSSNPVEDGSIEEHTRIIDSILSKDENAIAKASIDHILNSKNITLKTFIDRIPLNAQTFMGIQPRVYPQENLYTV